MERRTGAFRVREETGRTYVVVEYRPMVVQRNAETGPKIELGEPRFETSDGQPVRQIDEGAFEIVQGHIRLMRLGETATAQ